MVTIVPGSPEVGEKLVIVGPGTVKFALLKAVPPGAVTAILPVVAFGGTVAVIENGLVEKLSDATPLKVTAVAPVRPLPLIVTSVPDGPTVGENPVMTGDQRLED